MHRLMLAAILGTGCAEPEQEEDTGTLEAPGDVPVTDAELIAWAKEGAYEDWTREAEPHESAGPHFGTVLTFVNPTLEKTLGSGPHAPASAAVKELYGDGDAVLGWAVMVKLAEDQGWYWWEYYEEKTVADGVDVQVCTTCHEAGDDNVFTTLDTTAE